MSIARQRCDTWIETALIGFLGKCLMATTLMINRSQRTGGEGVIKVF